MKNQFSLMTPEERAENGRKGGIKSGEVKRKRKDTKETLEVLLSMPLKNGKCTDIETVKNFSQIKGKNITVQQAIAIVALQLSLKGDMRAMAYVRDTIGDNPAYNVNKEQAEESSAQSFIDALNDKADSLESAGDDVEE